MIVTIASFESHQLVLIVHVDEHSHSKLVAANWLLLGETWQHAKLIPKLKQHYGLVDQDFVFIDNNSLSNTEPAHAVLLESIAQLKDYIDGKRQKLDIPVDLSVGTQFQQKVWRALQQIPHGQTISYATLADNIGQPTAYRAVANANGKNPFSLIIPCHRVIASDGKLGGYTGGLDKKQYLLALEGVKCRQ